MILKQAETDSGVLYSDTDPTLGMLVSPRLSGRLSAHFSAATYVPTEWVEDAGETLLRAVADNGTDLSRLPLIRSPKAVTEFHGEALITQNGVVRQLRVDVKKADRDPESVELRFDPINNTPLETPAWVDTGQEQITEFAVSLINDGTAVKLSHTGGRAPSEYLQVSAYEGGTGTNIGPDFTDGFPAEHTAYLARTEESGLQIFDEPVSGTVLETPLDIRLWSGITLFETTLS